MSVENLNDEIFGYLAQPYNMTPYAAFYDGAGLGMQVLLKATTTKLTPFQVQGKISNQVKSINSGVSTIIVDRHDTLMQVVSITRKSTLMSVNRSLYNTYNCRILWQFASRGVTGSNWTVTSGSAAPGDFGANNLNTDIVEQAFRTVGTVNTTVVCDTQVASGVYVDTIGILNHNLRVTGSITVAAANDENFQNPMILNLTPDGTDSLIWISKTLPQQAYRYWSFTFNDNGNADGYLSIGAIVFGSASIFEGENVVSTIVRTPKHFADKVTTEGFTAVSNDRALKNSVTLEFRNLDFTKPNYQLLKTIFNYCRTSLKALWIPTPRSPTRFAVFGKLPSIPSEQHTALAEDADYINFTVEIDEAL